MADLAVAALASVEPEPLNLEAVIGFNGVCRWQHIMPGALRCWARVYASLNLGHLAATHARRLLSRAYRELLAIPGNILLHTRTCFACLACGTLQALYLMA